MVTLRLELGYLLVHLRQLFIIAWFMLVLDVLEDSGCLTAVATHLFWCTNSQCRGPFGGFTIKDVVFYCLLFQRHRVSASRVLGGNCWKG